jgi:hypothetical protein
MAPLRAGTRLPEAGGHWLSAVQAGLAYALRAPWPGRQSAWALAQGLITLVRTHRS